MTSHPVLQTAFVLSGQGSQSYFMARGLFDGHPAFCRAMQDVDRIFADLLGRSVIESLYDDRRAKDDVLDDVLVAHPGIFAVQYALGRTLVEHGVTPALLVGASLGELSAAALAGALSLQQAAGLVAAQAQVFDRARLAGGMIAILHHVDLYREMEVLARHSEIAAINYDDHFVVAGLEPGLEDIQAGLRARGISFQRLAGRQPFHSSFIDHLRDDVIASCPIAEAVVPKTPILSCTAAGLVQQIDRQTVWDALRQPIRIRDTIRELETRGGFNYVDLGPGSSFSNSIKRIIAAGSPSRIHQPFTPFARGSDAFERVIDTLGRTARTTDRVTLAARSEKSNVTPAPRIQRDRAYIFPGQGSQHVGMGATLFDDFSQLTEMADATLGYSIKALCTRDPDKQLSQTRFTQPALFVVNALTYFRQREEDPTQPAFVAGHSLGEYNALLAAGVFDFEVGLRLVKARGELMSRAAAGAMAAVVGCDASDVAKIIADHDLRTIDIANFNSPTQTVVSGSADDIRTARTVFEAHGARYVPLNVSAPFHSRYMAPIVRDFEGHLQRFQYSSPTCPVISNVTARPYEEGSVVRNLSDQLRCSVQWTNTVAYLIAEGVREFQELGPGRILTNLIAEIRGAVVATRQ